MNWRLFAVAVVIGYVLEGVREGRRTYWRWVEASDLSELESWRRQWPECRDPDERFMPEYARLCLWRGVVMGVGWPLFLIANLFLMAVDAVQDGATAHVSAARVHSPGPCLEIAAKGLPDALPTLSSDPPLRAIAIGQWDRL